MFRTSRSPGRTLRPAAAVAGALVAAMLTVSGCAAGQQSQTAQQVAAIDGANSTAGHLGLRNVVLATPDGTRYAKGSDARVLLFISNGGLDADTLASVSSPIATSVALSGAVSIPGQFLLDLSGGTGPQIVLKGLTRDITFGESVPVTFNFAKSGSTTANVPIAIPVGRTDQRPTVDLREVEPGASSAGAIEGNG